MSKILTSIVLIGIVIAISAGVRAVLAPDTVLKRDSNGQISSVYGYIIDRETVITGCRTGAIEGGSTDEQMIRAYCGCLYDDGVAQYGAEQFTLLLGRMGDTEQISPELNGIVNGCLNKAI